MDNPEFQPPKPRSMSDSDLELALEQAKAQADGMLGAMVLLEQQSQLRTEDDEALALWIEQMKADPRPEAQRALINYERQIAGLEPEMADPIEFEVREEADQEFVEPDPIPAPVIEEAAFDELLAIGAAEATSGIEVVDDFSVTGVVGKIVTSVDQSFEPAAEESATALEEQEADDYAPLPAFAELAPVSGSEWPARIAAGILPGLVAPVVFLFWASSLGITLSTALVGFAIGSVAIFGFSIVVKKLSMRGAPAINILARSTFGVFGNILPALVNLLFRVFLLVITLSVLVTSMKVTVAGVDLSATWNGVDYTTIVTAALVIAGLTVSLLSKQLRSWAGTFVFALAALWALFAAIYLRPAEWSLGEINLGQVVLIVCVLLLSGLALAGLNLDNEANRTTKNRTKFVIEVLVPLTVVGLLGAGLLANPGRAGFDTDALARFVTRSDLWFGTLSNLIVVLVAVTLSSQLLRFATDAMRALFLSERLSYILVAVLSIGLLGVSAYSAVFRGSLSGLFQILISGVATWAGMLFAETLLRRGAFHEVSLVRGYGFYRKVSIFAMLGYLAALTFAGLVIPVEGVSLLGIAAAYADGFLVLGALSAPIFGAIFGVVWTLITGIPKIQRQEADIAAIDERKQQIAGVELPS